MLRHASFARTMTELLNVIFLVVVVCSLARQIRNVRDYLGVCLLFLVGVLELQLRVVF